MLQIQVPVISMMCSSTLFQIRTSQVPHKGMCIGAKEHSITIYMCRDVGKLQNSLLPVHMHLQPCEMQIIKFPPLANRTKPRGVGRGSGNTFQSKCMHLLTNCMVTCSYTMPLRPDPNCHGEMVMDMTGPLKMCNNFTSIMLLSGHIMYGYSTLEFEQVLKIHTSQSRMII